MQILKKLLVIIIATGAFAFLLDWLSDNFGFRSFVFGFLANWLVMSWIAVIGQVVTISFGAKYYLTRPFEQNGKMYEQLGIRVFQRLVRRGPLLIFNPTIRFSGDVTSLPALENEMRKAEAGHTLAFLLMLLLIGYAFLQGWYNAVGWLMLPSIFINVYPAMLQRYNRIRLQRLMARQSRLSNPLM